MRCAAIIEERVIDWRASRDLTLQCQRNAKVGGLCSQHARMPEIYCGAHRSRLLKKENRFYCTRCGKRCKAIYSEDG